MKTILTILALSCLSFGQYNILNPNPSKPYPSAYYNSQLPGAGTGGPLTHLMPNSAALIVHMTNNGSNTTSGPYHTPGLDDFSSWPLYIGQATDPVWTITGCAGNSTTAPAINGQKFHAQSNLPYNGWPGGPSDSQILIYDLPTQKIYIFYTGNGAGQLPATSGGTFNHSGNIYCNADSWTVGKGYQSGSTMTGGTSPWGQIIRISEVLAGVINHGGYGYTTCSGNNHGVYPADQNGQATVFPIGSGGGSPGQTCTNAGLGADEANWPPNGALVFLDYTTAQLNCFDPAQAPCGGINKMSKLQFAIVRMTTLYGITLGGTGDGDSVALPSFESETAYSWMETHGFPGAQAIANQMTAAMDAYCVSPCTVTTRSGGPWPNASAPHSVRQWNMTQWANISLVGGLGVFGHMHIADPCVALGMEGLPGGCASPPVNTPPAAPSSLAVTVT